MGAIMKFIKKNYIYNEIEAERKKRQYAQICINQNMDKYVLGFANRQRSCKSNKTVKTTGASVISIAHNKFISIIYTSFYILIIQ